MDGYPWPVGAATGIGSLPGVDIREATRMVFGELPDLPFLPELPARGPGADMIGRTGGLLVDLPLELYAGRWRLASRPGRDHRRIADLRERDLDALSEVAADATGTVKLQSAGPWTLAANLEMRYGGPALRDQGAVRDLADSLAEGLRLYLAEVAARLPHATLLLQLDEPSLPAVLAGRIPTESGLFTLPAVDRETVRGLLRTVVEAVAVPVVVHCCAPDVPVDLVRESGAVAVALDLETVAGTATNLDLLGEALEAGLGLFAGAVAARPVGPLASDRVADRVRDLWRKLGFPAEQLPVQVVVTQACGLVGTDPQTARAALTACRDAARELAAGE